MHWQPHLRRSTTAIIISTNFHHHLSSFACSSSSERERFSVLLHTAISRGDLRSTQCVHSFIIISGQASHNRFFTNNIITAYSKCNSLYSARYLFDHFPHPPDHVTWNSILASYALFASNDYNNNNNNNNNSSSSYVGEGFHLFHRFLASGISPTKLTLAPVLKLCLVSANLAAARTLHGYAVKLGLDKDTFVSSALVNIHCKFGHTRDAWALFGDIPDLEKDAVLYKVMLKSVAEKDAFRLFCQFHRSGLPVDDVSVHCVLRGLSEESSDAVKGKYEEEEEEEQIRALATKLCLLPAESSDVYSGNKRISEYHRAGDDFAAMKCFIDMMRSNVCYDGITLVAVLASVTKIGDFELGQQVHGLVLKSGLDSIVAVGNSLINMYSKNDCLFSAREVFTAMGGLDLVSWNSMIASYAQSKLVRECVSLYRGLLHDSYRPDQYTFASILRSCIHSVAAIPLSEQVHVHALKTGNVMDNFVSTSLIDVYTQSGRMEEAELLVNDKCDFDLATWNSLMFGYIICDRSDKALELFVQMQKSGHGFDEITLATAAKACGCVVNISVGRQIHLQAIKAGVSLELCVSGGILDMYIKCGEMGYARKLFNEIPSPDDVAWTSMISGFVENGEEDLAISVYHRMKQSGVPADEYTFATLIKAASCLTALEQGRQIHANVIKLNCASDTFVGTSLVDMYAKCGNIEDAYRLFKRMDVHNIALWNAMLVGLAQHGDGGEALRLFETMKLLGIRPDRVSFIGVLSACSHSGLTSEANLYFQSMHQDYGIKPEIEHYSCLVDAVGRAGLVREAEKLIASMPFEASAPMYRALLGACRVQGDKETGKIVASKLLKLEPFDSAAYVLLSNIYAASDQWDEMGDARRIMKRKNVKKDPGFSWIDVKNKKHLFVVDDRSLPQADKIYDTVEDVISPIKKEGYVPDTEYVLLDVKNEE